VPGPLTTPPRRLGAQGAIAWPPWTLPRPANPVFPVPTVAAQVAQRIEARSLYWRGWSLAQIAEELALPVSTLSSWKQRQRWDTASPRARAEECLWVRYQTLLAKEQKTGSDFKEIDLLGRQFVTFARIGKFSGEEGNEADLNPARSKGARTTNAKKEQAKNLITPDMVAALRADMQAGLFGHQETWLSTTHLRTRMIVKSRQIGATWYFARERLLVALETGKNQIFLSASRAQANIFRAYIVQWVQKVCGVSLKGDPIAIQRGEGEDGAPLDPVELYFLGTNYRTAQGYHGDVVIDECFWIYGFEELFKVASAMATHKIYTRTLFSTPARSRTRPIRCGAATASTGAARGPTRCASRSTMTCSGMARWGRRHLAADRHRVRRHRQGLRPRRSRGTATRKFGRRVRQPVPLPVPRRQPEHVPLRDHAPLHGRQLGRLARCPALCRAALRGRGLAGL
jgi:uncharacterized protein YjcR